MEKEVICRGSLKEGFIINWFNNETKHIQDQYDFIFSLKNDETFVEKFKYIQDNNNLNLLRIEQIK